jgi:hypothetical protein
LLKELHTAESRQLVGAHVFEGEERLIETTDQMLASGGIRCPLEGGVLEHRPESGIAEDMDTA